MITNDTNSANECAPSHSLTALTLLADPTSTLLDRGRLASLAYIAFRPHLPATRDELAVLRSSARAIARLRHRAQVLSWLRRRLKEAITWAFGVGAISADTAQRLIDCFELRVH